MADVTEIELVYDGGEVNDGTVPVDYMIDALTGISSAFEKAATRTEGRTDVAHNIRMTGLQRNSAHILLNVVEWVRQNPLAAGVLVTGASAIGAGAYKVAELIGRVIAAKKHLAGAPLEQAIQINAQNIFLISPSKEKLEVTKQDLELLRSKILEPELDRLTRPLDHQLVTDFELKVNKRSLSRVSKDDRPYFVHWQKSVTSTKSDVVMEGTLHSLTKDRNRGTFHTLSGRHIPYRYVGNDQQALFRAFSFEGTVRARCKVSFDSDLNPTSLEITSIQLGQRSLFQSE